MVGKEKENSANEYSLGDVRVEIPIGHENINGYWSGEIKFRNSKER